MIVANETGVIDDASLFVVKRASTAAIRELNIVRVVDCTVVVDGTNVNVECASVVEDAGVVEAARYSVTVIDDVVVGDGAARFVGKGCIVVDGTGVADEVVVGECA